MKKFFSLVFAYIFVWINMRLNPFRKSFPDYIRLAAFGVFLEFGVRFTLKDYTNRSDYYEGYEIIFGHLPPTISVGYFFFISVGMAIIYMLFAFYFLASTKRWAELLAGFFSLSVTLESILRIVYDEFTFALVILLASAFLQTLLIFPKKILVKIKID